MAGFTENPGTDEITRQGNVFNEAGKLVMVQDNGKIPSTLLPASSGGVTDGDKGDITVSNDGETWTLDVAPIPASYLDTDGTLAANSDTKVPSQKAVVTYAAGHTSNTSNPHGVTKTHVGLGNCDNTSDANKPVSTATQTALNAKADLSTMITALAAKQARIDSNGLLKGSGMGSVSAATAGTDYVTPAGVETLTNKTIAAGSNTISGVTESISGHIEAPADKDYYIGIQMPHAGTINTVTTKCDSGTCTATVKINGTALGGTANSVSSSEQDQAHSSANTFNASDDITLTVSSNSSCDDMRFTVKYTRTLG